MILLVSHIDSWGGRVYLFFELLAHMVGGTRPYNYFSGAIS